MDHVVYLVHDLDEAAARIGTALGVTFPVGGSHPGGTANKVCAFEDLTYVELVSAVPGSPIAERVARSLDERGEHIVRWAVRCAPEDIDALADMLELGTQPGGVERDDGSTGTWTIAQSSDDNARGAPFLIAYDSPPEIRAEVLGRGGFSDGQLTWIECSGPSIEPWRDLIDDVEVRQVEGDHDRVIRVGLQINAQNHSLPL
jgi:hypothetical protein